MRLLPVSLAVLATLLVALPASAGAATSPQASIRFAWTQEIGLLAKGDAKACRYMTKRLQDNLKISTGKFDATCAQAVRASYLSERKRYGTTGLDRRRRADQAAVKTTKIRVSGASARARLRSRVGDCTMTDDRTFKRVGGRWFVDVSTANSETLGCTN